MIIETPIEKAPPVIGAVKIPEYARPFCDTWGNIKKEPVRTIEESHGPNFIKVFIFNAGVGYFYGYQLKLNKVVLQKQANITDTPQETEDKAQRAAQDDLMAAVSEKRLRKVFISFDKICYNQPELF
jgi:hypothetical protein